MKLFFYAFFLTHVSLTAAEITETTPAPSEVPLALLELEILDQSLFIEQMVTARARFEAASTPEIVWPENTEGLRIIDARIEQIGATDSTNYEARLTVLPIRSGIQAIPALTIQIGTATRATSAKQITVSSPRQAEEIQLQFKPAKTKIYLGEPLRLEVTWSSSLPLDSLRELEFNPAFFHDPTIEVVAPRATGPEDEQLGLPVGGRRIIANNPHDPKKNNRTLGTVRFPLFLRINEAGTFEIPATRIQCARLLDKGAGFTSYAAFFNNSFFEAPERSAHYEKLYGLSAPLTIEVLPLPEEGRRASFSGLFAPLSVTSEITPTEAKVGQVMELRLRVQSPAASECLTLPPLTQVPALRHRFWVSPDTSTLWRPDGREFITRFRPLTTEITAFPPLEFQYFNPAQGRYELLKTKAIPLTIAPNEGQTHFAVRSIPGAASPIESNAAGIWHNATASPMNNALDQLTQILVGGFWFWLLLGPILYFLLRSRLTEARLRASNPAYGRRACAYRKFRKSGTPTSFREFLAASIDHPSGALTGGDATRVLREAGADDQTITPVHALFAEQDATDYDPEARTTPAAQNLRPLARRIHQLLNRSTLLILLTFGLLSLQARADDWTRAEAAFAEALTLASEKPEAAQHHFGEAALAFEASAKEHHLTGLSWLNAGNAWFKTGEVGRAIAAYRHAEAYRPLDKSLQANLSAARALSLDQPPVPSTPNWLRWPLALPLRLQLALLAATWVLVWLLLLTRHRLHHRALTGGAIAATVLCCLLGFSVITASLSKHRDGVLIVDEIEARKGPGYSYAPAFQAPLHNGLEFTISDSRPSWTQITLPDGRQAWIPESSVTAIQD
jgi:tetratricopeptide (TPR) repeat protein